MRAEQAEQWAAEDRDGFHRLTPDVFRHTDFLGYGDRLRLGVPYSKCLGLAFLIWDIFFLVFKYVSVA